MNNQLSRAGDVDRLGIRDLNAKHLLTISQYREHIERVDSIESPVRIQDYLGWISTGILRDNLAYLPFYGLFRPPGISPWQHIRVWQLGRIAVACSHREGRA